MHNIFSPFSLLLCNAKLGTLTRLGLYLACGLWLTPAHANNDTFVLCANQYQDNDAERLKCYDQIKIQTPPSFQEDSPVENTSEALPVIVTAPLLVRSYLTRAWNLDDKRNLDETGLGRLQPHRQSYLLLSRTSNRNQKPSSPSHAGASKNSTKEEMKFQFSFKGDIGSQRNIDLFGFKTFRTWGAYTQQSNWQIFDGQNSSPFRATYYEPELIATLGTDYERLWKLINVGLVHQSNGQSGPESRSWNRVYVQGGWEWNETTSLLARRWWRLQEDISTDDNADITDYYGRADLLVRWEPGDKSQSVAILIRNNLRKEFNRGFVQIDWALPLSAGATSRVHLQVTSGYGESLIDYNHKQSTVALGFSFREW